MECEAISFNDVQDKSAWQQLLRQCVQQPRGRAQRQHRQAVTVYAPAMQRASCGAHVRPGVTDLSTLLSAQATCLSGVNSVAGNGSHVARLNTYPIVSQPWTSIYWVIFLPRAVSHFNSDGLFEECSFTHYRTLPLQHNVTGICGLFDPVLHPRTWG